MRARDAVFRTKPNGEWLALAPLLGRGMIKARMAPARGAQYSIARRALVRREPGPLQ